MVNVSQAFKDNIYLTSRKTNARVTFEIIDPTAYNNTVTVSDQAPFSRKDQISNKERTMTYKYGTLEKNRWLMDGSFVIPPPSQDEEVDKAEVGWWSQSTGDLDGNFATPPVATITFAEIVSSLGLTITFDNVTGETAKNFDVLIYNDLGALINQINFTDNSEAVVVIDQALDNYKKVEIKINQWSKGYHRATISEVDFGVTKEYTGEELISLKVIEEMDLLSSTFPSNEFTFTVDNRDRSFNLINPEGFYRFIQTGQEVNAYMGLKINEEEAETEVFEEVLLGTFYLTEWKSDLGALTTTFTARDITNTLVNKPEYVNALVNPNLYDLAVDILTKNGIEKFEIDERLRDIPSWGFIEPINPRTALQHIAIASQSAIYQNREGVVILKHFDPIEASTGYIIFAGPDQFAGQTTPEVDVNYTFYVIDFDNLFQEPEIVLESAVKSLTFSVQTDATTKIEETIENADPNANKGVSYKYDNPLIITAVQAQKIAEWMFLEYDFDAKYTAVWRQNPAFELGDAVAIEDIYGGMKKVRITKQEFNFQGYLDGVTEGKGGV
jgi:hypothetical protein